MFTPEAHYCSAGACPCCQVIFAGHVLDTGTVEPAMYRKTKRDTAQGVSFGRLNEFVNDGLDACYTAGGGTFSAFRKMQNMEPKK